MSCLLRCATSRCFVQALERATSQSFNFLKDDLESKVAALGMRKLQAGFSRVLAIDSTNFGNAASSASTPPRHTSGAADPATEAQSQREAASEREIKEHVNAVNSAHESSTERGELKQKEQKRQREKHRDGDSGQTQQFAGRQLRGAVNRRLSDWTLFAQRGSPTPAPHLPDSSVVVTSHPPQPTSISLTSTSTASQQPDHKSASPSLSTVDPRFAIIDSEGLGGDSPTALQQRKKLTDLSPVVVVMQQTPALISKKNKRKKRKGKKANVEQLREIVI